MRWSSGSREIAKLRCLSVKLHNFFPFPFAMAEALLLPAVTGSAAAGCKHRGLPGKKKKKKKESISSPKGDSAFHLHRPQYCRFPFAPSSWKEPTKDLAGSHRLRRGPGPPSHRQRGSAEPFPSRGGCGQIKWQNGVAGREEGGSGSRPAEEAAEGGRAAAAATGRRCCAALPRA